MSYSKIVLTSDINLSWSYPYTNGVVVSDINDIISDNDSRTVRLPDATNAPSATGTSLLFSNVGSNDFTLLDNSGSPIGLVIIPSEIRMIYLTDSSTPAGVWRMIPFGEGSIPISVVSTTSSNNSVNIVASPISKDIALSDGGTITSPGGNFDITISNSLQNLNLLTNKSLPGIPVITKNDPLTWKTTSLIGGNNITITDPDGVQGPPVFSLNKSVIGLLSVNVSNISLSGNTITNTDDGNLTIKCSDTGYLKLNGINIDNDSNVTKINKLTMSGDLNVGGTITGSIVKTPQVAAAWFSFADTSNDTCGSHTIIPTCSSGNINIVGANGVYRVYINDNLINGTEFVVQTTLLYSGTKSPPYFAFVRGKSSTTTWRQFSIYCFDLLGNNVAPYDGIDVVVFANYN